MACSDKDLNMYRRRVFLKEVRLFLQERTPPAHTPPSLPLCKVPPSGKQNFFFFSFPGGTDLSEVGIRILRTVHQSGNGHSGLFGRRLACSILTLLGVSFY